MQVSKTHRREEVGDRSKNSQQQIHTDQKVELRILESFDEGLQRRLDHFCGLDMHVSMKPRDTE